MPFAQSLAANSFQTAARISLLDFSETDFLFKGNAASLLSLTGEPSELCLFMDSYHIAQQRVSRLRDARVVFNDGQFAH